jgi:hypothetical protein
MAWRQSADDVLGREFGRGNRGWANVEVRWTSLSWKKFLLYEARFQSQTPVVLHRSSMHACAVGCVGTCRLRVSLRAVVVFGANGDEKCMPDESLRLRERRQTHEQAAAMPQSALQPSAASCSGCETILLTGPAHNPT